MLELLDLYREHLAPPPPGRPFPLAGRFIIAALTVARTPAVPLPPGLHPPPPTREEADAVARALSPLLPPVIGGDGLRRCAASARASSGR